jgi:CheY-like chemotaxis protein
MPKTLLLADDSVTIQKVVGISFANEDVRIVTVDNGDDAVARAKEIRPDIVLADVVMPGKSGYDVCAALKNDPSLAHVPVLLLTGTFETFDEDRAARVGADGHITKPFEAQALVELVNARLAKAGPARGAAPAAPAAKAAAASSEPEPFDFLEPEAGTQSRPASGTARPQPGDSEDAFAFDAEPLEPIDLETEADAEVDLGNEATAARTTLLLDDDSAFSRAATAPPVRASTAPPARPPMAAAPPAPPARPATLPPVRGGTTPPVSAPPKSAPLSPITPLPTVADFDDADELTRLVLPSSPAPAAPAPAAASAAPAGGDPLSGLQSFAAEPFTREGEQQWDVASDELDPFADEPASPRAATAADELSDHDDVTPPAFTAPIFDDDAAAEFELTEVAPPPRAPAPSPAPSAAPMPSFAPPAPAAAPAAAAPPAELTGAMRDQVHTTIEKIAWEALGDVSERIVKEAVARIEAVAWEVIPRLAETLIREEIRKMKGEDQ